MIFTGDAEVTTKEGDFPIYLLENKKTPIWTGHEFLELEFKKYYNNIKLNNYNFSCYYTYEGISEHSSGISFDTSFWSDGFDFKNKNGYIQNSKDLIIGDYLFKYFDNKESLYTAIFTGISEEKTTKENIYYIEKKTSIIIDGVQIINS